MKRLAVVLLVLVACRGPQAQPGPATPYPVSDPCRALSIAEDNAFTAMQANTNGTTIAAYSRAGEAYNDCIAAQ